MLRSPARQQPAGRGMRRHPSAGVGFKTARQATRRVEEPPSRTAAGGRRRGGRTDQRSSAPGPASSSHSTASPSPRRSRGPQVEKGLTRFLLGSTHGHIHTPAYVSDAPRNIGSSQVGARRAARSPPGKSPGARTCVSPRIHDRQREFCNTREATFSSFALTLTLSLSLPARSVARGPGLSEAIDPSRPPSPGRARRRRARHASGVCMTTTPDPRQSRIATASARMAWAGKKENVRSEEGPQPGI